MKLTRNQLEMLYSHMEEVAENSRNHEQLAKKSIRGTNRVIYIFTGLGCLFVFFILFEFILLNKAISHSLNSMLVINKQVSELRDTMQDITSSIGNMGKNITYLQRISSSVNRITQSTQTINGYMSNLEQQTRQLGSDTQFISAHTFTINQNFSQINQSVGHISHSVNQAVKPIKQFIPMP